MSREIDISAATFGLTGGMGSGKSTVSSRLQSLGAEIIDADKIVRELQVPGELGFLAMVNILGEEVVGENGELDRNKAAEKIFSDPSLRNEVDQTLHPMVWDRMNEAAGQLDESSIAVYDVPLLKPENTTAMLGVLVVNTDPDIAVEHLAQRGFTPDQARARIATQMTNEERRQMADFVILNNEGLEELYDQVLKAWEWMNSKAQER